MRREEREGRMMRKLEMKLEVTRGAARLIVRRSKVSHDRLKVLEREAHYRVSFADQSDDIVWKHPFLNVPFDFALLLLRSLTSTPFASGRASFIVRRLLEE